MYVDGPGTLTLSGSNTYSGGTDVEAGTLDAASPGALPGYNVSGQVAVQSGATLAVCVGGGSDWNSGTTDDISVLLANATFSVGSFLGIDTTDGDFTYAGAIDGSQGLEKLGSGTLTLTGSNAYSGGTDIEGGTLQLGDGVANAGSVAGDILDNSALAFANPAHRPIAASSAAAARCMWMARALTLSGSNTYSGGTDIEGGTLQLGDGVANAGSVAGDILDNSALVFANPGAQTYSGVISGSGGCM